MNILKMIKRRNAYAVDEVEELKKSLERAGLIEKKGKRKLDIGNKFKRVFRSLIFSKTARDYRSVVNTLFLGLRNLSPSLFERMKNNVERADIKMLPETYFSISIALSIIMILAGYVFSKIEIALLGLSGVTAIMTTIMLPLIFCIGTFTLFYMYPVQRISNKKRSIDSNLPFALNHMAAIASSGVPPEKAFEMLSEFKEYGSVSIESKKLVERIKIFGEDITTAMKEISRSTPSKKLKDLLYGMLTVIESGGNLREYLNEMAQLMLFNYKLERKKYLEALSTYADIYTAILIVAPLFLVSIMTVMNIIPGSRFAGANLDTLMKLGIYVLIPLLNTAFLIFISITQPEM